MSRLLSVLVLLLSASAAGAETVAVIGTGNVGMAIGTEFAGLGHTVIYGSRSPASLKTTDLVTRSGANASAALPAEAAERDAERRHLAHRGREGHATIAATAADGLAGLVISLCGTGRGRPCRTFRGCRTRP